MKALTDAETRLHLANIIKLIELDDYDEEIMRLLLAYARNHGLIDLGGYSDSDLEIAMQSVTEKLGQ